MSLKAKLGLNTATPESAKANKPENFSYRDKVNFVKPGAKVFKLPDVGSIRIRFLPLSDVGHWHKFFRVHYSIGAGYANIVCPTNFKKECPLCQERDRLVLKGLPYDDKRVKQVSVQFANFTYVIDRNAPQEGVQVYIISGKETIDAIYKASKDPDTGVELPLDDPDEAYDVTFDRVKSNKKIPGRDKDLFVNENIKIARKPSPLSEDAEQAEAWCQFTLDHPLLDQINEISPIEIEKIYFGDEGHSEPEISANEAADEASETESTDEEFLDDDSEDDQPEPVEEAPIEEAPKAAVPVKTPAASNLEEIRNRVARKKSS